MNSVSEKNALLQWTIEHNKKQREIIESYRRKKLDIDALRRTNKKLRKDNEELRLLNNELAKRIDQLKRDLEQLTHDHNMQALELSRRFIFQ